MTGRTLYQTDQIILVSFISKGVHFLQQNSPVVYSSIRFVFICLFWLTPVYSDSTLLLFLVLQLYLCRYH